MEIVSAYSVTLLGNQNSENFFEKVVKIKRINLILFE